MTELMRSLLFAVLVVTACGKGSEPPPPSSGSPNALPESGPRQPTAANSGTQAERMFSTMCVMCHGADGSGRGPAAASLTIKPRDYTDSAWQASVTDDQLKEIIVKGGAGVGKSPSMPGQPQLADQPEVLNGLVQIIRAFGKKP
jgi:cytochrome c553